MKKLFILILLVPTLLSYGQTDAEREAIISNYDQSKLKELKQQFSNDFFTDYNKALQLAKINNWPLKFNDKNGNLNMLVGVHDSGEPIYLSEENFGAGQTSRVNTLYPGGSLGLNLTGLGMTASIWDGGSALTTHQLFGGRVTAADGAASADHSTHCAGTIIGSDAFQSGNARGMAYQASLMSYDWSNDEAEMAAEAAGGMLISSHSYGISAVSSPTYYLGKYDNNARDMDDIVYNAPYFLPACSAGNDRNDGINASGYDVLTDKSCNKNALTVAAVNELINYTGPGSVVMSSFSSWGPTDDGRIKPDISAKGVSTFSAGNVNNSDYGYKSGTSMATPSVAGTLVLLQQHYNNVNGYYMLASTLRGLTLHTADEAGGADGPDYEFGWGLMNAKRASETINNNGTSSIIDEIVLGSGQSYTLNVTASGLEDLMATIAWTDQKGVVGANIVDDRTPVLINDLDIRITQAASTYMPWKLNPDFPANPATKGDNLVDNIEKVEVTSPSGIYTITITHKGTLSSGSQTFSLIVTGITPSSVPPTTNFYANSTNVVMGGNTTFNDQSQGNPTSWSWTFQGGTPSTSTLQNPTITYSSVGTYDVTLVATNSYGNDTETKAGYITVTNTGTVSVQITNPNDDVEEYNSNGTLDFGSSDLEMAYDGGMAENQHVGLRFSGVNLPQGAIITNAYIQFRADETDATALNINIAAEGIDNSPSFTTTPYDVTNRTLTSAQVTWNNPPSWTAGDLTPDQQTPSLTAIVQEIANRAGWATGNAMTFVLWDNGTEMDERVADSQEGGFGPILNIDYQLSVATDCNGDVGGSAYLDNCGICVGGSTGLTACTQDCNGDWGGTATMDNCGICVGGSTGLTACVQDCNGDWGGTAIIDSCGICSGGNTGLTPILIVSGCITGIQTNSSNELINIFPNPFENEITIQLSTGLEYPLSIEIRDYLGRKVYDSTFENKIPFIKISLDSQFYPGVYFVKVFNKTEYSIKKIIKLK